MSFFTKAAETAKRAGAALTPKAIPTGPTGPATVNTTTGTGTLPPVVATESLPPATIPTTDFFAENATALKIAGGVALAGVVGYFVFFRNRR